MPPQPAWKRRFAKIRDEYQKESDRAAAVLAAAYLDDTLAEGLKKFFIDDPIATRLVNRHPLQSFSVRIQVAYALGFLDRETMHDLEIVGEIRNGFAHRHGVRSFRHPDIIKQCQRLRFARMIPEHLRSLKEGFNEPRIQYLFTTFGCLGVIHRLFKRSRRRRAVSVKTRGPL